MSFKYIIFFARCLSMLPLKNFFGVNHKQACARISYIVKTWFVYVKIQVKSLYKMTPVFVLCTKWPDTLYDSSYQCQLPYLHKLFTYNSLLTPCYYETCISYTFQFVTLKIPQMCTWVIFQDIGNGRHSLNICGVYNTAKVGNAISWQFSLLQ